MDIRLTKTMVEVFFHGSRVASHKRVLRPLRDPIVQPEHMPIEHRKYLTYNADEFIRWAQDAGQHTLAVVKAFLSSGREPEQGYKSCASLTRLGDKYGLDRLEKACERVIAYGVQPSIRNISTVLKIDRISLLLRHLMFQNRQRAMGSHVAPLTFRGEVHSNDQSEHP